MVTELKEITSTPRDIEKYRGQVEYFENRLPEIKAAIVHIEELHTAARRRALKRRLAKKIKFWKQQEQEFQSEYESISLLLEEKMNEKKIHSKLQNRS